MPIGGIEQWVTVKGDSCASPIILAANAGHDPNQDVIDAKFELLKERGPRSSSAPAGPARHKR